jgi:hypothetical protein
MMLAEFVCLRMSFGVLLRLQLWKSGLLFSFKFVICSPAEVYNKKAHVCFHVYRSTYVFSFLAPIQNLSETGEKIHPHLLNMGEEKALEQNELPLALTKFCDLYLTTRLLRRRNCCLENGNRTRPTLKHE